MTDTTFQKQVLEKLSHLETGINNVKQELDLIREKFVDDSILTEEEKQLLNESYDNEREGRLISSKNLKKKLEI